MKLGIPHCLVQQYRQIKVPENVCPLFLPKQDVIWFKCLVDALFLNDNIWSVYILLNLSDL